MDSDEQKQISDAVSAFHRNISRILKQVDTISPGNLDVVLVRKLIRLCRDESPLMVIERCCDKLWDHRVNIMDKNSDFFMKADETRYIKEDENKEWLDRMVKLVRSKYEKLTPEENAHIWKCVQGMLTAVCKYRLLRGDHTSE